MLIYCKIIDCFYFKYLLKYLFLTNISILLGVFIGNSLKFYIFLRNCFVFLRKFYKFVACKK